MTEKRDVYFDHNLGVEAYLLYGISQIFPPHCHDYYVVGQLMQGQWQVTYRSRQLTLSPGDLLLLNPGDSHRCGAVNNDPVSYHAMNIPAEVMKKFASAMTKHTETPLFSSPILQENALSHSFQHLHHLFMRSGNRSAQDRQHLFFTFFRALLDRCVHFTNTLETYTPKVSQARKYIDENYDKNITMTDLCAAICAKPTTLFTNFTKDLSISPRRYLIAKRVNASKPLLGHLDVNFVATKAGFCDNSHFTHAFKSITGITPQQYKKSFLSRDADE